MEQVATLWQTPPNDQLKGKRDRALLAVLLARGLRRHEAVSLEMRHVQQHEDHWATYSASWSSQVLSASLTVLSKLTNRG